MKREVFVCRNENWVTGRLIGKTGLSVVIVVTRGWSVGVRWFLKKSKFGCFGSKLRKMTIPNDSILHTSIELGHNEVVTWFNI